MNGKLIVLVVSQVLLLGAVGYLGVRNVKLDARVEVLEQERQARVERRGKQKRGGGRTRGLGAGDHDDGGSTGGAGRSRGGVAAMSLETNARVAEALDLDLDDPETVEQIEAIVTDVWDDQRAERSERRAEYFEHRIADDVAAFGEEMDLDSETVTTLSRLVSSAATESHSLREAAMNGDAEWEEIRDERDALRTRTLGEIEALIGADQAEALTERVWWLRRH